MITQKTKEESGVYKALDKALNDEKYGKLNACYVIALLTGSDFRQAVTKYKAEKKAGRGSAKQGLYCSRALTKAKMSENDFQELRIFLERYVLILDGMKFKPRIYTPKKWVRVERKEETSQAMPELGIDF